MTRVLLRFDVVFVGDGRPPDDIGGRAQVVRLVRFGLQGRFRPGDGRAQHGCAYLMAHGETCERAVQRVQPNITPQSDGVPAVRIVVAPQVNVPCAPSGTLHGRTAASRTVQFEIPAASVHVQVRLTLPFGVEHSQPVPGVGGATAQPCGTVGHGRQGGRGRCDAFDTVQHGGWNCVLSNFCGPFRRFF